MLPVLNSSSQAFVSKMDEISRRMDRAQRQISTGLRVSSVSDEPDSVSTLLQTRADLASTQQIQSNLSRVKTEVDAGEQALQTTVSLVERARVLASQGVTGTATPELRQTLATEVGSIMEEISGLSGTSVEGRFIFSGDADQKAPYSLDLTAASPLSAYGGSAVTRQIQHPNGTRFLVARTAQEIFDSPDPTKNVFSSLNALRTALQNNDAAGINSALPNVVSALDHVNGELAYYGTVQNKVADATNFSTQLELQLKTHLSTLQDADLTEAILELNQARVQQDAALQAHAKIPTTSLFDYLR